MQQHGSAHRLDGRIRRLPVELVAVKDDESGQGLVEYAFILLLVALVAIGTLTILGTSLDDAYQTVVGAFP